MYSAILNCLVWHGFYLEGNIQIIVRSRNIYVNIRKIILGYQSARRVILLAAAISQIYGGGDNQFQSNQIPRQVITMNLRQIRYLKKKTKSRLLSKQKMIKKSPWLCVGPLLTATMLFICWNLTSAIKNRSNS